MAGGSVRSYNHDAKGQFCHAATMGPHQGSTTEEAGPSNWVRDHVCSEVEAGVEPLVRKPQGGSSARTCQLAAAGGASLACSRLAARAGISYDDDIEVFVTPKVVHDVVDLGKDFGEDSSGYYYSSDDTGEDSSESKASLPLPLIFFFK